MAREEAGLPTVITFTSGSTCEQKRNQEEEMTTRNGPGMYVEGVALIYRGSNGTMTVIAAA